MQRMTVFSSRAGSKSGHVEDFHRLWYALLKRANIEDLRFYDRLVVIRL